VLEQQRSPDGGRLEQAEAVIGKLNEAFGHYADTMLESDLSGLDVDLRLIERAVKDDLENSPMTILPGIRHRPRRCKRGCHRSLPLSEGHEVPAPTADPRRVRRRSAVSSPTRPRSRRCAAMAWT